ncbi:hypothetical protein [Elioraea sp.]|uniref:hypothetical protein n=1 Tax=Elioraea sp. TaxID=2185103 RepID=UPI003F705280
MSESWDGYAALAHQVGHDGRAGRVVLLPPAYDDDAAAALAALSPAPSLAAAIELLLCDWMRAGLARGALPGRAEARLWADALRHQAALRRGLPGESLWHGPRGRDRAWLLDLAAFVEPDQTFATGALARAAAAATTALEIAGPSGPVRAVAVVPAGVAGALMAAGVPYAWPEGRATAAALLAVVLGAAAEAAAALALRLGPCPAWTDRRTAVLRAMEAAIAALPPGADGGLGAAASAAIERGFAAARRHGLRVLGLVSLRPANQVEGLLGADSAGHHPVASIVRSVDGPDGRPRRLLAPAAARAILALGLPAAERVAAIAHIVGRGTLAGAPPAGLTRLATLGIPREAVEPHLRGAVSLAHAVALAAPGVRLPADDPALAGLERHAIGAGTADEAPFLPPRLRAALAEGAEPSAQDAMAQTLAPFLRLGLDVAVPAKPRRAAAHTPDALAHAS